MTMTWSGIHSSTLAAVGALALAMAPGASAQDAKPQDTHGVSIGATELLALGEQLPNLKRYALRLRVIVLQPGAQVGYHSHATHPVVAYLVSGDYTEHRDGQGLVSHAPGEHWVEGADIAHWSENRGEETTYLVNVDLVSAP